MKNNFEIYNDELNVYVHLTVNSSKIGKIILTFFVSLLVGILFYIPFTIPEENISEFIFPLLIFGIMVFAFPVRYLLWNLFGKENLIINTKSISYNREYGIFISNLKTLNHNRLATAFEWSRTFDNIEYGNIIFEKLNDKTDLPEHLYTTSIALTIEDIKIIENEISKLYENKMTDEYNFHPISLN